LAVAAIFLIRNFWEIIIWGFIFDVFYGIHGGIAETFFLRYHAFGASLCHFHSHPQKINNMINSFLRKIKKKISEKDRVSEIDPDEILIDAENLPAFDVNQFEGRIERPITLRAVAVLLR